MLAFFATTTLLLALGAQQGGLSVDHFKAADEAAKLGMLRDAATPSMNIPIGSATVLIRAGLHDPSVEVRTVALAAVYMRTMSAHWARTPGLSSAFPSVPAEWQGDVRALIEALEDDCLGLLKDDSDDRVRHQALLAIGNLHLPTQVNAPFDARLLAVFVDLYRHDPSVQIRTEVVKTFRLWPNSAPEMRAVLRDALVDANASIRWEGLSSIKPESTPASRLSFDEARDTVVAALSSDDPGIRLGAVQALSVFGAPAAPYVQTLERLSSNDPDAAVQAAARLAIGSIQRALERP